MNTQRFLMIVAVLVGCTTTLSPPPREVAESVSAGQEAQAPTCEMLREAQIPDGNILVISNFLKSKFEDWSETRDTDWSSEAPWPKEFSSCSVEAKNEIMIEQTTCDAFRVLLTDTRNWRRVYSNAHSISPLGTLTNGGKFSFRTFGSDQDCVVENDNAQQHGFTFAWTCSNTYLRMPLSTSEEGVPLGRVNHRWNCTMRDAAILVSTQECQYGKAIEGANVTLGGTMKDMMQRGHQAWLEGVKCKLTNPDWGLNAP